VRVGGGYLACLNDEEPYEVCPTCQGAGYVPNPDGPAARHGLVELEGLKFTSGIARPGAAMSLSVDVPTGEAQTAFLKHSQRP